jgi:hypothetical protein
MVQTHDLQYSACDPARNKPPLERWIPLNVFLAVELLPRARTGHISNLSEDWPFKPGTVELSYDRPRNSCIQAHCDLVCLSRRWAPLQNLFAQYIRR